MSRKFISYEGFPIRSGGAHSLSHISGLQAYLLFDQFAETFADDPEPYCTIEFNASGPKNTGDISFWFLIKNFGLPKWSLTNYLSTRESLWTFYVSKSGVEKVANLHSEFENVTLTLKWKFSFVDPDTRIVLPGQDYIPVVDDRLHNSQIYLRIGKKKTVSLWFTLPFGELDHEAISYIKQIKDKLPVRMSENQWRIWMQTNKGLTGRKLDISIINEKKV
jgi:hypothetical protein